MLRTTIALILLLLGLGLRGAPAHAGDRPKTSSRDEYRKCLEEGDRLEPLRSALEANKKAHDRELKRLQDEMNAHVATQPFLDTADEAAVEEFNAKLEVLNQRGKNLNDVAEELNKQQSAYNAQVAAANKRCAAMVITFRDRDAVNKERSAQGKK